MQSGCFIKVRSICKRYHSIAIVMNKLFELTQRVIIRVLKILLISRLFKKLQKAWQSS